MSNFIKMSLRPSQWTLTEGCLTLSFSTTTSESCVNNFLQFTSQSFSLIIPPNRRYSSSGLIVAEGKRMIPQLVFKFIFCYCSSHISYVQEWRKSVGAGAYLVLSGYGFYIKAIIKCVLFSVWLLSLHIICQSSMLLCAAVVHSLLVQHMAFHWVNIPQFIYPVNY